MKKQKQESSEVFDMKTTIIIEHRDEYNKTSNKVTFESYEITLPELLRAYEQALRGAGFIFDGTLDIIDEKTL